MWGMALSALTIAVSFLTESGREDRLKTGGARADTNARVGGGGKSSAAASGGGSGWLIRAPSHSPLALPSRLLDDRAFLSGACEFVWLSLVLPQSPCFNALGLTRALLRVDVLFSYIS
jgi:hypothetical protein